LFLSIVYIMHEMSIIESLLSLALDDAKKADARRIVSIKLIVGELTGVEKEAVSFCFGFLAKNTIAAGALLDFNYTKAQLRCRDCDFIFPWDKLNYDCPKCLKKAVEIVGGRELYIESLEVE
jgi:hydrogenase nickel incorporation protein HypA/HybF